MNKKLKPRGQKQKADKCMSEKKESWKEMIKDLEN